MHLIDLGQGDNGYDFEEEIKPVVRSSRLFLRKLHKVSYRVAFKQTPFRCYVYGCYPQKG